MWFHKIKIFKILWIFLMIEKKLKGGIDEYPIAVTSPADKDWSAWLTSELCLAPLPQPQTGGWNSDDKGSLCRGFSGPCFKKNNKSICQPRGNLINRHKCITHVLFIVTNIYLRRLVCRLNGIHYLPPKS